MPRLVKGQVILSDKEQKFYQYLMIEGLKPRQAALKAGYSQGSAENMGFRLRKALMSGPPAEAWKSALAGGGFDFVRLVQILHEVETEGRPKDKLAIVRMILASHGIATTGEQAGTNTFNIQGPAMVILGEDERRRALRDGSLSKPEVSGNGVSVEALPEHNREPDKGNNETREGVGAA